MNTKTLIKPNIQYIRSNTLTRIILTSLVNTIGYIFLASREDSAS
jgi:hypothetical protein